MVRQVCTSRVDIYPTEIIQVLSKSTKLRVRIRTSHMNRENKSGPLRKAVLVSVNEAPLGYVDTLHCMSFRLCYRSRAVDQRNSDRQCKPDCENNKQESTQ